MCWIWLAFISGESLEMGFVSSQMTTNTKKILEVSIETNTNW